MTGTPSQEFVTSSEAVPYFCYGSNLCRETISSRHDPKVDSPISFSSAHVAVLQDYALSFNVYASPPTEPVMASVTQSQGSKVYGMLYFLTNDASWKTLLKSEGGADRVYQVRKVSVQVVRTVEGKPQSYDQGNSPKHDHETVEAFTLMANSPVRIQSSLVEHFRPSKRYLTLMITAAKKENLPTEYIAQLESVAPARVPDAFLRTIGTLAMPCVFFFVRNDCMWALIPLVRIGERVFANMEMLSATAAPHTATAAVGKAVLTYLFVLLYSMYIFIGIFIAPFDKKVRNSMIGIAKMTAKTRHHPVFTKKNQ